MILELNIIEFTRHELESNLVTPTTTKEFEIITKLIREGWSLENIYKQIENVRDPNSGLITVVLTRQ